MNKCLAPNRVAVLVIDMQNDFCSVDGYIERSLGKSAERCRAIAQPIMELVGAARSVMAPVIWIKADYSLDLIPCHMRAKRIERGIEAVCCAPTDWGSEFYGVRPDPTEPIVVKHCYSGFIGTDLETSFTIFALTRWCLRACKRTFASKLHCVMLPRAGFIR
jgi:ureidoacrylate peracid hydrolase